MKYYVTYTVMDGDVGSNPFWHASLLLSTQIQPDSPIEVIDAIGFYGQPNTTTNPIIRGIKRLLGFSIDLQNGHGVLKQEQLRYLDGNGLHGINFEVTKEQFDALKKSYEGKMAAEKTAIDQWNRHLGASANGKTRYLIEKEQRPAGTDRRLRPFHFSVQLTRHGLDSSTSYTCKNYALDLLFDAGIITEETRHQIKGSKVTLAFPRFSALPLVPLRFVSFGNPMLELSSTYTVNLNRIWGDATKLYWATSPDYPSTKQERQCHMQEYQAIKKILSREQHIELKLRKELMTLQGPSLSPKIKQRVQQLEDQVTQLEQLKQLFQTNDKTPLPKKLMLAEKTLNIATIALTPHRMNYSFLLRAYHSAAMRNALLGLLCCMLLSSSITNPIAALFLTTTALLTGQQIYRFFKEDQQCRKACSDYKEAHKQPPIPHRTSDPERLAPS